MIASSYPHDDGAVLFLYTRYVKEYGWDWVAKLANQSVAFHRGSDVAADLAARSLALLWMSGSLSGVVHELGPGLTTFMEDRAKVEEWKQTFALYFGEVQGKPTPGVLGVHPGL
ncbi:ATP-binding Cassette (ABC) Superfamily [Phytophthora cinnamomi]|uniref:ATP-binding Cassette (ABC) Superfamily n=1 Tax=Phytophthora cinnamomi TaxID=4785 RepID=UPI00355A0A2D|nr:ATP-binding Cassette (ABC) Superfamily [Phytophthora cinnamomi]KAG6610293.1 ATP-binding Cassette (ABC) Superfamily [Phytophthora cinnamomi]